MKYLYSILLLVFPLALTAQEITLTQTASPEQVYGDAVESEVLLPFNDLDIEFGYVLYQADVEVSPGDAVLELENVRDYAVIYLNDRLVGTVTDNNKRITLTVPPGTYTLRLYAENIGRITYGPEILDNSKGLFGSITLGGEEVANWTIIPLGVKDADVSALTFDGPTATAMPAFHKGCFEQEYPQDTYLDISGWGMGEAWINGNYIGSYWEEEKQQSIQVPASILVEGSNEVVVFELKNNGRKSMQLSDVPVFK